MKILRECNNCENTYEAETRYLNRGQGTFCSRSCSSKFNTGKRSEQLIPNVECAHCGIAFYKNTSKQKNSKSGLFFCSREHKDLAQRIGGIEEIQPDHYGTSSISNYDYRKLAFSQLPNECQVCGYNVYIEVLQVNHIDCDRTNNSIENLEILCPTHHMEYHFTTKTGPWGPRPSYKENRSPELV